MDKYSGINSKLALQIALGKPQNFLDGNNSEHEDDDSPVVGVYVKAFCSGVNDLLKVYK